MSGVKVALASVALVFVAAACGSSTSRNAAAPPAVAPSSSTSTKPTSTTSTTLEKPKPFDPTKPIDLGGTPGVTPAEQHRAEALLRATIADLRKYTYPAQAVAAGYHSIGDALTGDEHYVKWSDVNDGHILDPTRPESLVYENRNGTQQVVAAMYMLPLGSRFTDTPDVGGALTQWHVHEDICLTDDPTQKTLSGLVAVNGVCAPGSSKAGAMPMLHVWVAPNPCGPFAALEGVGAGQVPAGQSRLCDTAHGSTA
jgi:hypothetical protein